MENSILITNIQRFSLHDGPGIRTTVFLKGCSLRCPWCANPENLNSMPEPFKKDGKNGIYGRWISCRQLFEEIMKDKIFYKQKSVASGAYADMPGGVTFSGGEPLLQIYKLESLLKCLREENIDMCIETALFVPSEMLVCALKYIDLFFVDIKILDESRCFEILGGDLNQYKNNVEILFSSGKPVVFRIPVIGGFTDSAENCHAVLEWVKQFSPIKVELIKEHNLGESKYLSLGKMPLKLSTVTNEQMEQYKSQIELETQIETEVCAI